MKLENLHRVTKTEMLEMIFFFLAAMLFTSTTVSTSERFEDMTSPEKVSWLENSRGQQKSMRETKVKNG